MTPSIGWNPNAKPEQHNDSLDTTVHNEISALRDYVLSAIEADDDLGFASENEQRFRTQLHAAKMATAEAIYRTRDEALKELQRKENTHQGVLRVKLSEMIKDTADCGSAHRVRAEKIIDRLDAAGYRIVRKEGGK